MKHLILFSVFVCSFAYGRAQIITTIAGIGTQGFSGDNGPATDAELLAPADVAIDGLGNVYIADSYNNRIRRINSDGIIATIAGNDTAGYNGDNIPATAAQLWRPGGVACDGAGNVFIADAFNHRIRKIDVATGIISTIAGTDTLGYNGDDMPATNARLYTPYGICVDAAGNIYIADSQNSRIRKVDVFGIITTIAGTGIAGSSGDNGPATNAEIDGPHDVAVDNSGNIFFSDYNRGFVKKIDLSGTIRTVAGSGNSGTFADNCPATNSRLNGAAGIAVDDYGDLYICDALNARIREVNLVSGIITTIAGNGAPGYGGDNGPATDARVATPVGVCVSVSGILIADFGNHRVRQVDHIVAVPQLPNAAVEIEFYPNPSEGLFNCVLHTQSKVVRNATIVNSLGKKVKEVSVVSGRRNEIALDVPDGMYTVFVNDGHNVYSSKLIVKREY